MTYPRNCNEPAPSSWQPGSTVRLGAYAECQEVREFEAERVGPGLLVLTLHTRSGRRRAPDKIVRLYLREPEITAAVKAANGPMGRKIKAKR